MTTPSTGARAAAKVATREALIDAAIAEFTEHGPNGASLDAICARAGRTRGAFYVHFADREALLVAAMDRLLGGLVRSIGAAGEHGGLAAGIRHFAGAAAARTPAVHAGRELRFHHLLEACRSSRVIGERYRMVIGAATEWARRSIEDEQRGGRIAGVDAAVAAQILAAFALGVVSLLELGVTIDPTRLGDGLVAMLGIGPPARRRPARRRRGRNA